MPEDQKYRVDVQVEPRYVPEQSDPENERYVFAYTVTLQNTGAAAAQLQTRHWIVTDGNNENQEVHGEGVVGEKPRLEPGEEYTYTSWTWLETPVGTMEGSYDLVADDGTVFSAPIPRFTLAGPRTLH
ncbi:MAG TPA: Co2+/Mg2+ efflux protein ApaG [Gammaproteobacteria bacterium]|nr:Co2+/Mg2+ efflux protein ApaG [Gammaproteobacteria bacterium]